MDESASARIMVIDNDERVGVYLREILEAQQYAVHVVEGFGKQLIETALQEARRYRPHVAIVDLRLVDDYSDDRTGLTLLEHLYSTRCILHSNYLTAEVLRTVRRKYPEADWADKHEPSMVLAAVEDAAKQMSARLTGKTLLWPPRWEHQQIAARLVEENTPDLPPEMLDDIVVQLFPQYRRIQPEAIDGAIGDMRAVVRGGTFVAKVYPDHFEPQILKLSNAAKAQREQEHYRQYIQHLLVGLFSTQLVKSAEFWDLGGAVYNFIGASNQTLPTFATFYGRQDDGETILRPLRHFFTSVWRNHYDDLQSLQQPSLFDAYDAVFALRQKLQRIDPQAVSRLAAQLAVDLPDPVHWVEGFGQDSRIPRARQAVVHGDLHGDNLFVDGEHAWVIDFERTGPSHSLRDFVELELDLVTRLIGFSELDLPTFYRLALVLAEPSEPGGHFRLAAIVAENSIAYKAIQVIAGLREIAHSMTHYVDQHEYVWGLLFNALYVASARSFHPIQRERALLFSAILCEKLRSWSAAWPPKDWLVNE